MKVDNDPKLAQHLMTARLIAGSLVMGVVIFLVVAIVILGALEKPPEGQMISLIAAGFALMAIVLSFVVPAAMGESAVTGGERPDAIQAGTTEAAAGQFQTRMIVRLALLEGAAFFNIVALFLEHNRWTLGVIGVLVLFMLFAFPTRTRLEHFLENRDLSRYGGDAARE